MRFVEVTLLVCHALMFWLKTLVMWMRRANMDSVFLTASICHELMFWSNCFALSNVLAVEVTLPVCHALMFWLKIVPTTPTPRANVDSVFLTASVCHEFRGWLKARAASNMPGTSLTDPVRHESTSGLQVSRQANRWDVSVTCFVSQHAGGIVVAKPNRSQSFSSKSPSRQQ